MPVIYLPVPLPIRCSCLPPDMDEPPLIAGIHSIAPHRVYLVSLQPNCTCFLLHLSSSHDGRLLTFMLLFDVRTFLPQFLGINKLFFLWSAKIRKLFDVRCEMLDAGCWMLGELESCSDCFEQCKTISNSFKPHQTFQTTSNLSNNIKPIQTTSNNVKQCQIIILNFCYIFFLFLHCAPT